MVTGELLRRFRLPRLTGYLLFGVLVGPYLGNVITQPMARELQTVNGIATALIAFIAGLTLNFERLGFRMAGTGRFIATTIAVAMLGLFGVAWISWAWLPVAPDAAGIAKLAMVTLFVIVVISFSPTMTAAVISDTGARGRLSDLVLAIVVLADLVALVLFSVAMQFARLALGEGADARRQRSRPARLGDPRRAGVWRSGRRAVRAVSALRGTRGDAGAPVCVRPAQPGRQDAGIRTAAGRDGRRHGDPERRGSAGRRAEGGNPARGASGARRVFRRDRDVAAA